MTVFTKAGQQIFAPVDENGNARSVSNQEAQVWSTEVEAFITAFVSSGGLIYSSKASLDADLAHAANSMAWVLGDAAAANNGIYRKIGASGVGSWTRVGDLPYSFIIASDAGAGTPNAIIATTAIPVSESALILLNIADTNTQPLVTVAFNGGSALTVKTNSGENVATGGLVSGMLVMGVVSGSTFRLTSDQVSSAIVAAAEAAQVAAEAARDETLAAAAGVSLPAVAPSRFLVDNAAGTVRESKTFPEVRDLLGIDRPKRAKKIKLLLTADWQCVPEVPEQLAAERAMMDDIQAHHSDTDFALNLGDLVDRPTENSTGAASPRGYKELFEDMRSRISDIPLSRWLFLSGNHDRDGTGSGAWKHYWGYRSYRNEVGPLWYSVDYGNLRVAFMGDMAGSVSGEILDVAVDWFRRLMENSKNFNVIVCMHQPADATVYPPAAGSPDGGSYQRNASRLTDIIAANDNVVACFYGHVGSTLADATLVTTAYGTTWMNLQMGIPTAVTNGFDLHYALAEIEQGATSFDVRRWNATDHDWLGLNDSTITLKYPAQLSGDHLDFDGRKQIDPQLPYVYGPHVIYQSITDFRRDGPFSPPAELLIAQKVIIGDDAADNLTTQGTGTAYYVPGNSDSDVDGGGGQVYAQPGYGLGGVIGFKRAGNDDTAYDAYFQAYLTSATGTLDLVFDSRPIGNSLAGIGVPSGAGLFVNSTYVVDQSRHFRIRTYTKAELLVVPSTPVGMLVRCSDGDGGVPCLAVSMGSTLGWARVPIGAVIS